MSSQAAVRAFLIRHGLGHAPEVHALDLVSEMGEVAKAMLESSRYGHAPPGQATQPSAALTEEMGDAFFSLVALAESLGIDMETALYAAMNKYEARLTSKGHTGSGSKS